MMRFLKHPLFLSLLALGIIYVVFAYLLYPPLPKSLLIQYMVICTVGVLLVATFDDRTAARMAEPIMGVLGNPRLLPLRIAAFVAVMGGVGWLSYVFVKPNSAAPLELRTIHPAPPSSLKVYGKTVDLLTLQNPIREQYSKDSEEFAAAVGEGKELYYKNCYYCHGDKLEGQGHFAGVFNPRPINFQDVGTIAQLQESFLFWRITKGGPGLPREGTPWASAMPVWEEMLDEEDVWKIITFLYDYTGHEPRSWELDSQSSEGAVDAAAAQPDTGKGAETLDAAAVDAIYMKRCSQCHGEEGDGLGVAAETMYPAPRDFTMGLFKYKTTDANSEFPTDEDLRNTIRNGLTGTAMPAWKDVLSDAEIDALIQKIKVFGYWDEEDPADLKPIELGTPPKATPELIARGRELFVKACVQCHGDEGRGNITSGKRLKDDAGNRIWPRNLTRPETWRVTRTATQVFQRLSTGIPSTPMPEHTTTMSIEDRWAIADYVMTLREGSVPLSQGETVVKAVRVDGDLPEDPKDPAWDRAPAMTFAMSPNIIKEPRLFTSLNDMVTVRALYNDDSIALRLDVDDRTFSVPGSELERQYALQGVDATRDAVAVQLPQALTGTSEKPWFRHGDKDNPVNMWYWAAPSQEPQSLEMASVLDATGPNKPPVPRADSSELKAHGEWKNGRWQVVFKRALKTDAANDFQFEEGAYTPIAFADWDGLAGEKGGRHSFTSWYWLLLEPEENPARTYGIPAALAVLAGLLFLVAARRARKRYS